MPTLHHRNEALVAVGDWLFVNASVVGPRPVAAAMKFFERPSRRYCAERKIGLPLIKPDRYLARSAVIALMELVGMNTFAIAAVFITRIHQVHLEVVSEWLYRQSPCWHYSSKARHYFSPVVMKRR